MTFSGIIMFTRGVGLATPDNIAMLCMGTPILHYNFVTWTGEMVFPPNDELKRELLHLIHDKPTAAHVG